jgi:hypothetical protein
VICVYTHSFLHYSFFRQLFKPPQSGGVLNPKGIKNWLTGNGFTLDSEETRGRDIKLIYKKDAEDEDEYQDTFFITEILFDGRMGYIRSTTDWTIKEGTEE